ncbi:hypothetical protein L596_021375 [Steinernema carpocapsae]|uniref:Uncharacterized protein n=1 Tax=Steinernema carpocapsae TaxID=34508 RepID=A0A4U5MII0_STECR|nr:hypothetical protein L596_021375 [Steinernema carpocapsae]
MPTNSDSKCFGVPIMIVTAGVAVGSIFLGLLPTLLALLGKIPDDWNFPAYVISAVIAINGILLLVGLWKKWPSRLRSFVYFQYVVILYALGFAIITVMRQFHITDVLKKYHWIDANTEPTPQDETLGHWLLGVMTFVILLFAAFSIGSILVVNKCLENMKHEKLLQQAPFAPTFTHSIKVY